MAWKNHIVYLCQQKLCCRHSPTDYKVPLPAFFSSCGKKLQPVPAREPFCLFHCTTGLICNFHQEDFPVAVSPILAWGLWSVAQSPLVGHLLVVDPMDSYWSHYCWILSRMTGTLVHSAPSPRLQTVLNCTVGEDDMPEDTGETGSQEPHEVQQTKCKVLTLGRKNIRGQVHAGCSTGWKPALQRRDWLSCAHQIGYETTTWSKKCQQLLGRTLHAGQGTWSFPSTQHWWDISRLSPVLGSPKKKKHEQIEASSTEGQKDDEGTAASFLQEECERVGLFSCRSLKGISSVYLSTQCENAERTGPSSTQWFPLAG